MFGLAGPFDSGSGTVPGPNTVRKRLLNRETEPGRVFNSRSGTVPGPNTVRKRLLNRDGAIPVAVRYRAVRAATAARTRATTVAGAR
ncbi:hypothetical protein BKA10_002092 [Microbacterium invictum]|uniref:Uncharacterized protein n=1 Tax=Microbacterium invictum TaxID=515415 RepID=A0AA40VND4_9MICO|nr:hypothetical protein [Microbacterium invictum]